MNLVLNEIKKSDDPTIIPCTFIVLDYDLSGNNVILDKEVALEAGKSLINKPIVAKYNEVEEPNTKTDNFGGHEQFLKTNKYGELTVASDTVPIGVFVTEGYEMTLNIDGEDRDVMAADAVLWSSRFPDACDLLVEWFDSGINVNTSCEYLYSNFTIKDGVEYHHSPIYFEGHAILASENRGEQDIVLPAYESSRLLSFNELDKFNKLVAEAMKQENEMKECETMPKFKKVFELSHTDVRSLLYKQLDEVFEGAYSYITDVYETYFILNVYKYDDQTDNLEYDKYYKVEYSKGENDTISINADDKVEVQLKRDWVEVTEFEQLQNSLDKKEKEVSELKSQLNEIKVESETIASEKSLVEKQFNDASEKIILLNSQVEELKPFKLKAEEAEYEKALNEKTEFYSAKFSALNASDKFEEDETQELVKKAVFEDEEGKQATLQLNTILVDMVVVEKSKQEDSTVIREMSSKREKLIPTADSFEDRYGL
ncbi:hypothetical protein M3572_03910 [Lederbergia lenta]|nr:hypothetical protein [Lederbergia lenta]MCM3110028.1 hypothetical protein [Lederbergia lenta]